MAGVFVIEIPREGDYIVIVQSDSRPTIFISATSRDLSSVRRAVKDALLALGCTPVEQFDFPPDPRTVREMLRARLRECHAVIHIVGRVYGSEPLERGAGVARRSYTQLEFDIARELGKPVYVFICGDGFPYDSHDAEAEELRALQDAHRSALMGTDRLYELVEDAASVERRVLLLQDRLDRLRGELANARRRLRRVLWAGAVGLVALGAGLGWIALRVERNSAALAEVETELDRQRRSIELVANAYARLQGEVRDAAISPEERWTRALEAVAVEQQVPPSTLRSGIELFVEAVRSDPAASFLDRALADFGARDFSAAATNAGSAVLHARTRREAAERLASQAAAEASMARVDEIRALRLEGQAKLELERFEQAVASFDQALALQKRTEDAGEWAMLQFLRGLALVRWSQLSQGAAITSRLDEAGDAYRSALEVWTVSQSPHNWASTRWALGNVLRSQARASVGAEGSRLLAESVLAYESALQVFTRAATPDDWAKVQISLAMALTFQSEGAVGSERTRLLGLAEDRIRAALQVQVRERYPGLWAASTGNLSIVLRAHAKAVEGPERKLRLDQAVEANRSLLGVFSPETHPRDWAKAHAEFAFSLLASVVAAPSDPGGGLERARMLEEAEMALRSALRVLTREANPRGWAGSQDLLGVTLRLRGEVGPAADRIRLLDQAIAAHRAGLEVHTRDQLPLDWAASQCNLATALHDQAMNNRGMERVRILDESILAFQDALGAFSRTDQSWRWANAQVRLAGVLFERSKSTGEANRVRHLEEVAEVYRSGVEVLERQGLRGEANDARYQMANALFALGESRSRVAASTAGPERLQHLRDAAQAMRSAIEIHSEILGPQAVQSKRAKLEEIEVELQQAEGA